MRFYTKNYLAFTLVELAVAIAILALLMGGIVGAQSLIKNEKLKTIAADASKFLIISQQFKMQYGYFPGDFPQATVIWGRADGGSPLTSNCAAPTTTANVGVTTCNGDGDDLIQIGTHETFRAWAHLSAANMIQGQYTGVEDATAGASRVRIGSNVPKGPLESSGFGFWAYPTWVDIDNSVSANTSMYDGYYGNIITFGAVGNSSGAVLNPALTVAEAYFLDTKTDDGRPATGKIITLKPATAWASLSNCAVGTDQTATYNLSYTSGVACSLLFLRGKDK